MQKYLYKHANCSMNKFYSCQVMSIILSQELKYHIYLFIQQYNRSLLYNIGFMGTPILV